MEVTRDSVHLGVSELEFIDDRREWESVEVVEEGYLGGEAIKCNRYKSLHRKRNVAQR